MIPGQKHHSRRQGLPERGHNAHGPVAPLVEAGAGRIQVELRHIVHNKKTDGVFRSGLGKPVHPVGLTQPAPHGGLDHRHAPLLGGELGPHRPAPDGKGSVPGDPILPGDVPAPVIEGIKVGGGKPAQPEQHPFPGPQAQVGPDHALRGIVPQHPAVFRPDVGGVHPLQLLGADPFQPKQGGRRQVKLCHFPPLLF